MADTITYVYLDPVTLQPLAQTSGGVQYKQITRDSGSIALEAVSVSDPLADAKTAKIDELTAARDQAIYSTFTSSALGPIKTYGYSREVYEKMRDEAILLNLDSTIATISWGTLEDGFVDHTRAQFVQVLKDGAANEKAQRAKLDTKQKQVNAATTIAAVGMIGWPKNPNPPSVPSGLVGTAGTGQAVLTWAANSDVTMTGGGGYNVYVDGTATAKNMSLVTGTTFTVTGLTSGAHTFAITAVDTDGNESAKCASITVTVS